MLALLGRNGLRWAAQTAPRASLANFPALSTRAPFIDFSLQDEATWKTKVLPAFRTFQEIHLHLMVTASFKVPYGDEDWPASTWGYPLGQHTAWLRKMKRRKVPLPEYTRADLRELNFPWNLTQYKWEHFVLPSIKCYFEIYGRTDVPKSFVIPKDDPQWPERLWGRHLGHTVHNIRNRNDFAAHVLEASEELDAMDFCYSSTIATYNWRQRILPSLKVFRQLYGHCDVGTLFVVPSEAPWPERAWGIRLGSIVNNMRSRDDYEGQVNADWEVLDSLGFVWKHIDAEWNDRVVPGLVTFQKLNGHCKVPRDFLVPAKDPWPECIWGYKLGAVMRSVRYRNSYFSIIARDLEWLTNLGLKWRIWAHKWERHVEPPLKTFEKLYGHRDVPQDFVVPSEEPWSEKSWGFQLGRLVRTEVINKPARGDKESPELSA